jgi:putative membrane protein
MPGSNDPRVYFAAERTLLAWVRTGIAVMGLGFVVARFGLFLRIAAASAGDQVVPASGANGHRSAIIGVALVLVAVAMMLVGAVQHLRFLRTLGPAERPPYYSSLPAVAASAVLGVIGVLLAVSLLIWSY